MLLTPNFFDTLKHTEHVWRLLVPFQSPCSRRVPGEELHNVHPLYRGLNATRISEVSPPIKAGLIEEGTNRHARYGGMRVEIGNAI